MTGSEVKEALRRPVRLPEVDPLALARSDGTLSLDHPSVVRVVPATHSIVSELRDPGRAGSIMIKTITRSWSAEHAAEVTRTEFDAIRRLWDALPEDLRPTVPTPLGCYPDQYSLAMSSLPGTPLARLMRSQANAASPWGWTTQVDLARRVGQWLGRFQRATSAPSQPLDVEGLLGRFRDELQRGGALGWPADETAALEGQLANVLGSLRNTAVACAARHGDFSPQNVLVHDRQVGIVDWENLIPAAPCAEDAGHFSSYLWCLGTSPWYSGIALRRMRSAFLTAWGGKSDTVLALYELLPTIAVIVEQMRRPPALLRRVRISLLLRAVRRRLAALQAGVAGSGSGQE